MKKYLLVIIMAIFTLCASAQGASPTKQEIDEQCSILQDNIILLRSKLVDIKTAEQNKVLEMKGEVSNDLLASNDSLIDKAARIVKKQSLVMSKVILRPIMYLWFWVQLAKA